MLSLGCVHGLSGKQEPRVIKGCVQSFKKVGRIDRVALLSPAVVRREFQANLIQAREMADSS